MYILSSQYSPSWRQSTRLCSAKRISFAYSVTMMDLLYLKRNFMIININNHEWEPGWEPGRVPARLPARLPTCPAPNHINLFVGAGQGAGQARVRF